MHNYTVIQQEAAHTAVQVTWKNPKSLTAPLKLPLPWAIVLQPWHSHCLLFYGQLGWFILGCKWFFYIVPTAHENPKIIIKHHDHPLVQKRQVSFKEIFWRLPKKISVHSPLPVSSASYVFSRALWESLIYFQSSYLFHELQSPQPCKLPNVT